MPKTVRRRSDKRQARKRPRVREFTLKGWKVREFTFANGRTVTEIPEGFFADLGEKERLQDEVVRAVRRGATTPEAARIAGVSFDTVRSWLLESPDFEAALFRALDALDRKLKQAEARRRQELQDELEASPVLQGKHRQHLETLERVRAARPLIETELLRQRDLPRAERRTKTAIVRDLTARPGEPGLTPPTYRTACRELDEAQKKGLKLSRQKLASGGGTSR